MSKRRKHLPPLKAMDRHHICFQRRLWKQGYAKLISSVFVRYVPIVYHRELHAILSNVPLPSPELLKMAWNEYKDNKSMIDSYDMCRTISWLYVHIPDVEFRKAMQLQLDFFASRLSRSK